MADPSLQRPRTSFRRRRSHLRRRALVLEARKASLQPLRRGAVRGNRRGSRESRYEAASIAPRVRGGSLGRDRAPAAGPASRSGRCARRTACDVLMLGDGALSAPPSSSAPQSQAQAVSRRALGAERGAAASDLELRLWSPTTAGAVDVGRARTSGLRTFTSAWAASADGSATDCAPGRPSSRPRAAFRQTPPKIAPWRLRRSRSSRSSRELAALPSPPGEERAVADRVAAYLRDLGLEVAEDDAGARIGSNAGNLYAAHRARPTGGAPIFLCAHLDTVPPEGAIEPGARGRRDPQRGRDDPRRRQQVGRRGHARGDAADPRGEPAARRDRAPLHAEGGGRPPRRRRVRPGAAAGADRLRLRPGGADRRGDPRRAVRALDGGAGSTAARRTRACIRRRAARRSRPRRRRSRTSSSGRVDEESTANVGIINGGTAGNIVPEWCTFLAEARSHDPQKLADLVREMLEAITFAASLEDCQVETEVHKSYSGYRFKRDDFVVRLARAALERAGLSSPRSRSAAARPTRTSSTSAASPCVNLANGMAEIHTPDEHIAVADLERHGRRHARARGRGARDGCRLACGGAR